MPAQNMTFSTPKAAPSSLSKMSGSMKLRLILNSLPIRKTAVMQIRKESTRVMR